MKTQRTSEAAGDAKTEGPGGLKGRNWCEGRVALMKRRRSTGWELS
jgi:hypothetical protein